MPKRRLSLEVPVELLDLELLVSVTADYSPPDRRPICSHDLEPPDPGEVDWWLTGCTAGDVTLEYRDMAVLHRVLETSKQFAELVEEAAIEQFDG